MQRKIAIALSLIFIAGCNSSGNGKNALFSASGTRVPAPGTNSYGTATKPSYYNDNGGVPPTTSWNGSPSTANPSAGIAGTNQPGDLNWRPTGTRPMNGVAPAVAQIPIGSGVNQAIAPASYATPAPPPYAPNLPTVPPTSNPNYGPAVDANDITRLPRATNMPRINVPNYNGSANPAAMVPPTSFPSMPTGAPGGNGLNWRSP